MLCHRLNAKFSLFQSWIIPQSSSGSLSIAHGGSFVPTWVLLHVWMNNVTLSDMITRSFSTKPPHELLHIYANIPGIPIPVDTTHTRM